MSSDIPSTAVTTRAGCLVPAMVLLIAVGVLGVAFLGSTCIRGGTSGTFEADLSRFAVDDPVYISGRGYYVVRFASGQVIALDEREARREDYLNGRVIRYRESLMAGGRTGVFQSEGAGALFDLMGRPISGDAPPMKRHPVSVSGNRIKVASTCINGDTGSATPCKPS